MGGPKWPSMRQSYVIVNSKEGTIIASDGLSDPYDDFDTNSENQPYNGIGCEFYIECDQEIENFEDIKNSWQFSLVYQAAQLGAGNPNISSMIEEYGYISTELYDCTVPKEFINEDERCGVLLGLSSTLVLSQTQLSIEKIKLLNVKLLTIKELEYINENGVEGRNQFAKLILNQPKSSKSFLNRESVV
jgi:Suppressor of fused protein (SUFU)